MAVAVLSVDTRFWVSDKIKRARPSSQRPGTGKEALSKQLHAAPYRRTVVNFALKFSGFDRLAELKSNILFPVIPVKKAAS